MGENLREQVWAQAMNVQDYQDVHSQQKATLESFKHAIASPAGVSVVTALIVFLLLLMKQPVFIMKQQKDKVSVPRVSIAKLFGIPAVAGLITFVVPMFLRKNVE